MLFVRRNPSERVVDDTPRQRYMIRFVCRMIALRVQNIHAQIITVDVSYLDVTYTYQNAHMIFVYIVTFFVLAIALAP